VPVSTSQVVVGAVLGIGLVKGINTMSRRTLVIIFIGWLFTPELARFVAIVLNFIIYLRCVPA
jgi:inorganic phosphate transporter, PiT family